MMFAELAETRRQDASGITVKTNQRVIKIITMSQCTCCRKKECKSRKLIIMENVLIALLRFQTLMLMLAGVQFKDFVQWMNNDFLFNIRTIVKVNARRLLIHCKMTSII